MKTSMYGTAGKRPSWAFTMVEVMVAAAIGVMLLGILYSMFSSSSNIERRVEGKNELIQSATLAVEVLKRDLMELVTLPPKQSSVGYEARLGDARNPVFISRDGRQISFYIPIKGDDRRTADGKIKLQPVNYRMLPVAKESPDEPNRYYLVRTVGAAATQPEEVAAAATGGQRNVGAVYLEDIQFKLFSPFGADPDRRVEQSPDNDASFYVVTELVATTSGFMMRKGEKTHETLELRSITPLEQPSRLAQVPDVGISQANVYEPDPPPLKVGLRLVSLTPPEEKALKDLTDAAKDFEDGDIPGPDLENKVRKILKDITGPGNPAILVGPANPPDPTTLSLNPNSPPGVVQLTDPQGNTVNIPTGNGPGAAPPALGPAPAPGAGNAPTGDGSGAARRDWYVKGTKWSKTYKRNPVTGELELVDSSSSGFTDSGGENVSGNGNPVDLTDLQSANQNDINRVLSENGF